MPQLFNLATETRRECSVLDVVDDLCFRAAFQGAGLPQIESFIYSGHQLRLLATTPSREGFRLLLFLVEFSLGVCARFILFFSAHKDGALVFSTW